MFTNTAARPHNCAEFAYLSIERLSASVNGLSSNSSRFRWQLEGWSEKVSRFRFLERYSRTSRHCPASLKMRELNLTTAARMKRPQFFARNLLRLRSQQLKCIEKCDQNSNRNKQALHRLQVAEAASLSTCGKCVKILTIGTSGSAAQSKPSAILHSSNDVICHVTHKAGKSVTWLFIYCCFIWFWHNWHNPWQTNPAKNKSKLLLLLVLRGGGQPFEYHWFLILGSAWDATLLRLKIARRIIWFVTSLISHNSLATQVGRWVVCNQV